MNDNLPEIKREGFFQKFKKWFKRLFNKEEIVIEEPINEAINELNKSMDEMKKNKFIEEIKVESKDKILALQRKLKEKQIEIADLTDEELDEMIELYKEQIQYKKDKLKKYKNKVNKN